jgi:hypothetical protein
LMFREYRIYEKSCRVICPVMCPDTIGDRKGMGWENWQKGWDQ